MSADTEAISVANLSKYFGPRVALDNVSLVLPASSFIAVMGRNGAGKSTLINAMAGLSRPTSGSIAIMGRPVSDRDPNRLSNIGVVPSPVALVDLLTCAEQLHFTLGMHGITGAEAEVNTRRLLRACGIEHEYGCIVGELSKGCKKRLALACALANDPVVLLLDEPFSDIDPVAGDALAQNLADIYLHSPRIVVMVTHDPVVVATHCTHLVILETGHVHLMRRLQWDDVPVEARTATIVQLLRSVQDGCVKVTGQ